MHFETTLRGRLADLFDALDPGLARSRYALRATLAMFLTWAIVYSIEWLLDLRISGLGIFAVIASFVCNYIISEARTGNRIAILATSLVAMSAAIGLVVILARNNILMIISVVTIFYLAYYLRKFSMGLHLFGFIAVASLYFAWVFNVDYDSIWPFLLTIIVAALSNLLLWSILMPPRPIESIRRAVRSFYLRSAVILSELGKELERRESSQRNRKRMRRQLRRLERSKRMIEGIVPEVLDRRGLSELSERIRTTLFTTLRAIQLIFNEIEELLESQPTGIDGPNVDLSTSLTNVSAWLRKGAPPEDQDRLRSSLQEQMSAIRSYDLGGNGRTRARLLRVTAELSTVFEGARALRALSSDVQKLRDGKKSAKETARPKDRQRPLTQSTRVGHFTVTVPTLMAVQALAASFIALGVGYALGLFPLYQTFWFALITVSGSLGETRLKSFSRIIGTVSGIIVGLALVLAIDGSTVAIVVAILIAFFFLEFSRTVSLNWFIFFLVTMMVVAMAGAGADPLGFSGGLFISSLIGVGAALLATTVLFPIRIRDRYLRELSDYLSSVKTSLQAYLAGADKGHVGIPEGTLKLQMERFKALDQVSRSNLVESNPFSSVDRDRSYETTTVLESLNNAIMKLNAETGQDRSTSPPSPPIIVSIVEVITRNITAIGAHLTNPKSGLVLDDGGNILKDWIDKTAIKGESPLVEPYRRDIFPLLDIHDIVLVMAKSLTKKN